MSDYLDPANEELLKDFFVEAELQIEMLESNILVLENDPTNSDAVDEIFRAAHTLKGASATVQMTELAEFTHVVEDTLDEIRSGKVRVDGSVVDTLLASIDVIKAMLSERQDGGVYNADVSGILNALRAIVSKPQVAPVAASRGAEASNSPVSASPVSAGAGNGDSGLTEYELLELREAGAGKGALYKVEVRFLEDNPMNSVGGIQVFAALKQHCQVLKTIPEFDRLYEDVYHPVVHYFVASEQNPDEYRHKIEMSDVTESVRVVDLSGTAQVKSTPAAASKPATGAVQRVEGSGRESVQTTPARKTPVAAVSAVADVQSSGTLDASEEDVESAVAAGGADGDVGRRAEGRRSSGGGSLLRVDSRRIDNLLNLVSETVINKATFNQVSNEFNENLSLFQSLEGQYREQLKDLFDALPELLEEMQRGRSVKDVKRLVSERFASLPTLFDAFHNGLKGTVAKFRNTSQNLGRITSELQEGVMRIRMVPISQIFSRFPRLVRDLSRSLNKQIDLVIEGEDTELDKSIIEDLLDPLIHCVRNSIDHGIEDPTARQKAGKRAAGTLLLKASNEGNMILIEVADDGKGIDVEAVRTKAVDRGLIHPNKQLSDVEAFNLIFDAGFSTAREITNVSGRGVGLDVVKRQIEKLNGSVTVSSEKGTGTRFVIKIPLTLAIIQGLLVRVGKEMYAIPITSVIDSHRIRPSDIKMIDNYEVFSVRDDVISLIRLNRLFRIKTNENPEYHYVVIVGSADRKMGLIVDSLIGEEDVVIKPLRDHFTNSPGIAGANITGDGRVSLIIDVSQLLELGLKREREERSRREMTIG